MIELSNVHLELKSQAGKVHILKGIDLHVDAGRSTSVVGASGSGKSSLLAIIGGIEKATSGSVEVDGVELTDLDEDALALFRRDKVGIIFQSFHLIPTMTAIENVALPLELDGSRKAQAMARERLAEIGLAHRLTHYPGQLSGGEQQRVALARALVNRPRLLLADEPTGNLDSDTGAQIVELLFRAQKESGTTLFLVTHDERLAALCDEVVLMQDGHASLPTARVAAGGIEAEQARV